MLDFAKYSFNKSHAAAYAIIAYICMYLKTYHPREFMCSWINSVSNNIDKISECIIEAKRLKIPVYLGKYNDCSSTTVIYKDGIMMGTNTFRGCNKQVATDLMSLGTIKGSFIDVLDAINDKHLSIDTTQLKTVIGLNYFSDFGNNQYLLSLYQIYNGIKEKSKTILPAFRSCKQISKNKILSYAQYGISDLLIKKYAHKETAKQYSEIDNIGLLNELATNYLKNNSMGYREQIKFDLKVLNYTLTISNASDKDLWIVIGFKTYKDITKPYLLLHNVVTGDELKTKITKASVYKKNPIGMFSMIHVNQFVEEFKRKRQLVDGELKWVSTDETESVLDSYEVRKE